MGFEQDLPTVWPVKTPSFEAIYREHAPRIAAFLRQTVGSPQAAEDITQEVFAQLWRQPRAFDPTRGTLRAYLFGMAKHRSAEWWRQARPECSLSENFPSTADPERESVIADVLRRLPEDQRMLLWLREVEGQSYAELAVILEIPIGTVRSRLFTARQAFRVIWLNSKKGGTA